MTKILIIEDDVYVRAGLKELLVQSKYEVKELENGNDIELHFKKFNPDLVICDIMMKGQDGYEILEKLRARNITIPFIFLTAKCDLKDIRKGMNLGADDYLVKPYRAKDLLNAIKTRLAKNKKIEERYYKAQKEAQKKNKLNKDSVIVIHNKVPVYVKYDDIVFIKAESEYSSVYLDTGEKLFVRKLLKYWEEKLPEEKFLRIHRSTIVNLEYIKTIENNFKKSYKIKLRKLEEELSISQRYATKIKKVLSF